MFHLILEIEGLTQLEQDELLKKIEIIKYNIYKNLKVERSVLKHSPNWIKIDEDIEDMEKAFMLFKLLSNLNIKHEHDEYYGIYETPEMNVELNYNLIWE